MVSNFHNIYNKGKTIFLFERDINGNLDINTIKDFYPYYYEKSEQGAFKSYTGDKLKRIIVSKPSDVKEQCTKQSYESDILYTKRFIIDKIDEITKSNPKYIFLDIEILTRELPDTKEAKYPISCITIYNSYTNDYMTWYLGDWQDENDMFMDFVDYLSNEKPDIILAWNIDFDYTYLFNRFKYFSTETIFSTAISPILESRYGKNETMYPAGISIVDYKGLYEKLTLGKRRSYALDFIAQEDLAEESFNDEHLSEGIGKIFSTLNPIIKEKNINDVRRLVSLEEKFKILAEFDTIRRFSKCLWEDLPVERKFNNGKLEIVSNNSKIIDMIVLQEAKNLNVILPRKPEKTLDDRKFEGAYRDSLSTGVFYNVGKYDLSGAYLYAIIDLCLDTSNISDVGLPINITDRKTASIIETVNVKQNKNALLPIVVEKLVNEKNKYKDLLKNTSVNSSDYENIEQTYKAVKGIVLSSWGVIANKYFRLYDYRVASMITSVVRDLIRYITEETEKLGFKVLYVDTDSVFCLDNGKDISVKLNELIQKWAIDRFKKPSSISFDFEGHFEKILILTKCHYYGYLKTKKGTKKEIKGVEVKRSSSSKYEAYFQEALINKILDKETQSNITSWILNEQERIKTVTLIELGFPSKISNNEYDTETIFLRAYNNSKELFKEFDVGKGDPFYYIFVKPLGQDKNGKPRNVIAFTEKMKFKNIEKMIDWDEVIRRTIYNKAQNIFEILNWGNVDYILKGQTTLF